MMTITPLVPTPPAVPLATVKDRLAITTAGQDAELARLITAATALVEDHLRRALVARAWRLVRDGWPAGRSLCLPRPPLLSVEAVRWRDPAGAWQTLDPAAWLVETAAEPGLLLKADGQPWPATDGRPGAVVVEFTAGFGPDPAAVPETIADAVVELVAAAHDEGGWRLPAISGRIAEMLAPWRILQLA